MPSRNSKLRPLVPIFALLCAGSFGCSGGDTTPVGVGAGPNGAGGPGAGGGGGDAMGTGGGTDVPGGGAAAGGAPPLPEGCATQPKLMPQRVVRLTNAQYQNSVRSLLGAPALEGIDAADPRDREFQTLRVEGDLINIELLRPTVALANKAAASILPRYTEVTGCAAADDPCARTFVAKFAAEAYRRPLSADELASLTMVYDDNLARFAASSESQGVGEAVQYTVEAILASPHALYRTEIGAPAAAGATRLTAFELADATSYFLLDGPPDAALLEAAASGALDTKEGLRAQVARLLQTEAAKENLWRVLIAYYELKSIDETIKDELVFPEFTVGIRNSMYQETALFLRHVLENGKVDDLLTSRTSFVNAGLADLYGVPAEGATDQTFVQVEMPADRAGLLTQGSTLSMRARTDDTSVVSRGLYINSNVLCIQRPPAPPEDALDQLEVQLKDTSLTERARADERASIPKCGVCHSSFDTYGVVLEPFDSIGRYRTTYPNGETINSAGPVPPALRTDGEATEISQPAELAQIATETGVFSGCMTQNMMRYALSDALGLLDRKDCGVTQVHAAFLESEQTFADLVTEVIVSDTLSTRQVEAAQ